MILQHRLSLSNRQVPLRLTYGAEALVQLKWVSLCTDWEHFNSVNNDEGMRCSLNLLLGIKANAFYPQATMHYHYKYKDQTLSVQSWWPRLSPSTRHWTWCQGRKTSANFCKASIRSRPSSSPPCTSSNRLKEHVLQSKGMKPPNATKGHSPQYLQISASSR